MNQTHDTKWFSFFYRTRVKVMRGDTVIVNLSLLFMLLAVCSAPWLAVAGLIFALALGYRFSLVRNDPGFCGNFDTVVQNAARNVQNAVDSVVEHSGEEG